MRALGISLLLVGIGCLALGLYSLTGRSSNLEEETLPPREIGYTRSAPTPQTTAVTAEDVKQSARRIQVEIHANQMWTDTGLDVTGKSSVIRYLSGQWSNGGDVPRYCAASGLTPSQNDYRDLLPHLIVPSGWLGQLVAKTETGTYAVGNYREGMLGTGKLYLSMNDIPNSYDDNTGTIIVEIVLSR